MMNNTLFRKRGSAVVVLLLLGSLAGCSLLPKAAATQIPAKSVAQATFTPVFPSPTPEPTKRFAILSDVDGDVLARQPTQAEFNPAVNNMSLQVRGQVKTGGNGKARLTLAGGGVIRIAPNTLFTYELEENRSDGQYVRTRLDIGKIWVILQGGTMDAYTPSGVAGIRGSYLSVMVDSVTGEVSITCLEGNCTLRNTAGTARLVAGQTAKISNAASFPILGLMTDEDVQNWLLNNPEAMIVIPALTATASVLPTMTKTPIPLATITPWPTPYGTVR